MKDPEVEDVVRRLKYSEEAVRIVRAARHWMESEFLVERLVGKRVLDQLEDSEYGVEAGIMEADEVGPELVSYVELGGLLEDLQAYVGDAVADFKRGLR